jgi:hypothetical protein
MKIEDALEIVRQACAAFRGTLKDHQVLQQALQVLRENLADKLAQPQGAPQEDNHGTT